MTLNEIAKKLIRQNKGRYLILSLSICFAILMTGAYGVLLFSPAITDVLMTDGSTYLIALGMYGITVLGIVVFLFYANSIFMKFQMGEIGIFLSLGMPPKAVTKMHNKQFDLVFTFSGVIGVVLSIPFAFAVWSFLTLFLSYTDHTFTIGWQGIFIAILIWISAWGILRLKNTISLSKADVIKILHSSSENEEVKGAKPILGLLGLFAIPMGVILFNITAVIDGLKTISMLFLVISLIGGYLLTAQITTIGTLVKRFFPKAYRKNILFYNLVRQKGNQYTLSLFVSSLLIALTVFSICFNGSSFLELHYQVKEDPYDYAVLTTGEQQKDLDESTIRLMAEEHNISTSDWHSLDMLLIGREHQYQEKEKNEWGPEFVISQSSFEDLTGQTLSLPENGFGYFEDSDNATFQTFSNEQGNFYNPSVHKEFHLTKTSLISEENIVNNSTQISYFLILNDKTFQELKNSLGPDYQFRYYLFNGDHPENSKAFQDELLGKIVTLNNGEIFDSYQEAAVQDKISGYSDVIIPYAGNELYAARQWDFYPYAKATQLDILLESGSVYLLLIFFIAIIAFVSASMIMCLIIAGTILQDQESYQRAVYLGLKERDLKKMIRKQIALIYFFPTFCGSITAIFMINRFMAVSSVTHISAITVLAVLLSVVVVIIQIIAFGVLQRRMTAVATKAVYEKNY